jgi:hypothetical protein
MFFAYFNWNIQIVTVRPPNFVAVQWDNSPILEVLALKYVSEPLIELRVSPFVPEIPYL